MSEHTPITGELRGAMERYCNFKDENIVKLTEGDFDRLCDAIDAVHAQLERENAELRERVAKLDESADSMHDGWVRLPVDADGVPIHVGDVMDGTCPSGRHVNGTVSAIGDGVFWLSNVQFSLKPNYMHHYHAPTVEDVLREFALKVAGEECMTMRTDVVEEYAAKLREVLDE